MKQIKNEGNKSTISGENRTTETYTASKTNVSIHLNENVMTNVIFLTWYNVHTYTKKSSLTICISYVYMYMYNDSVLELYNNKAYDKM